MTASTLPVLLLIAFLWWRTKGELLPIVLFTSIFDGASALNVAGSPISPWLLALIICLPIKIATRSLRWKPIPGLNRAAFFALLLFVTYGVFSSVSLPFLFHGILVTNARNGMNAHLTWTMSNFTQVGYLLAAFAIYLIGIHSSREQLRLAVTWYVRACICIAFFSMYQLANATVHVPFPSAILYTNTTHVLYNAYKISGVWRLNSTFSEAAAAAFYLGTGLALLGWHLMTHRIRWQSAGSFLLMLVALVLTVSTLGYACLGAVVFGSIFFYLRHTFHRRGVAPVKMLLILALVGIAVPVLFLTDAGQTISKVLLSVFVNKVDSDSYRERTLMNTLALQTSHDSFYLGAGWGSVRASSFACSLMGNVGIPGVALFLLFLSQVIRPLFSPARYARFELFERSLFGMAVMLLGLVVAGSDPVMPVIWVLFAVATASKPRKVLVTGRDAAPSRAPVGRPSLVPTQQS